MEGGGSQLRSGVDQPGRHTCPGPRTGARELVVTTPADATAPAVFVDESGEWLDRREMARLAGCSDYTIKRDAEKHQFETRTGPKGEALNRVSDFVGLGRIKASDIPTGLTGSQAAEMRRLVAENARLTAQVGELTGRLAECRISLDVIVGQLSVKDAQIDKLLKHRGPSS
jgi:hypothetical protein